MRNMRVDLTDPTRLFMYFFFILALSPKYAFYCYSNSKNSQNFV